MYSFLPSSLFNARFRFHLIHPHLIIQCKVFVFIIISSFWGSFIVNINKLYDFEMRALFSFPISEWIWMQVHAEVLAHFTTLFRMVTKYFCKTDILSMASPGKRNQGCTWTTFCSLFCMPELLPKVGVLLACFFDRYKNFKFINWYLDVTIEYKYNVQCFCLKRILNIIIQAGIFREYRNKCFWRPKCFGKAIPQITTLQILSGKGAVQIMPLRK